MSGDRHGPMNEDPLARIFAQPVEPLAAPAGHFDEIVRRARGRRAMRTLAAAAAIVLVAGLGVGASVLAGLGQGTDTLGSYAGGGGHQSGGSPVTPASPTAASATPTAAPQTSPAGPTPSKGASLPAGTVLPPEFHPWSMTSLGNGVQYALGSAFCHPGGSCATVVRTTDDGRRWVALPGPKAPLPNPNITGVSPGSTVRDLRFASERDGWAYGGALYATHDGAASWHRVNVPGSVLDLETDGSTVYAIVATCTSQGLSCQNPQLMSSPVGGDNWRAVSGVARTGSADGSVLSLSGSGEVAQLGSGTAARLFARDGARWTDIGRNPCGPQATGLITASASGSSVFAFCAQGAAGSLILTGYTRPNAASGSNWTPLGGRGVRVPDGVVTVTAASPRLLFVAASTPDLGEALMMSQDGGRTWQNAPAPRPQYGWRYVGASSASTILAVPGVPGSDIYRTDDGGRTWQKETIS